MKYTFFFICIIMMWLVVNPEKIYAQVNELAPKTTTTTAADTVHLVEILKGKKGYFITLDDSTKLQILAGDVKLKQGTTLFYCDSCVINKRAGIFEAFGRVHINDA